MKKQLFTFVMMIALVIVTGSAMGQTNKTPIAGGTYSYSLSGIKVGPDGGTATIEYLTGSGVTIQNVNGAGALVAYAGPEDIAASTTTTLTFDIKYSNSATDGKIKVTVIDGATGGCSNFIELGIDVQSLPTLALSIAASETTGEYCQNKNASPLVDNHAATVADPAHLTALDNSFTFTVTPTITNATNYTYDYTIDLPTLAEAGLTGYSIAHSGTGSFNAITGKVTGASDDNDQVFTITFTTTTGLAPVNITGTISAATLTENSGDGVYTGTFGADSDAVNVKTMPSIVSFDID